MAWVSPTGHNDPGNDWLNETRAYDEYLDYYATRGDTITGWEPDFLELTCAALDCDKIRHYSAGTGISQVDLDIYYSDDWHHVYQGVFTASTWEEKSLGGIYSVTAMRVRYYHDSPYKVARAVEFDFWEVEAGETHELTATSSIASSITSSLTLGTIELMTATCAVSLSLTASIIIEVAMAALAASVVNIPSNILRLLFSIQANAPPATSTTATLTLGVMEPLTSTIATVISTQASLIYTATFSSTIPTITSTQASLTLGITEVLVGTVVCASSTSGSLTIGKVEALSGTASITSSTSSSLTIGKVEALSGTASITSSTSSSLTIGRVERLSGTASVVTSAQASLVVTVALTSTAAIVISTQGILSVFKVLTGAASAVSSISGSLTLGKIETLNAVSIVQLAIAGKLNVILVLSGTNSTTVSTSGSLTVINLVKQMKKLIQLMEIRKC